TCFNGNFFGIALPRLEFTFISSICFIKKMTTTKFHALSLHDALPIFQALLQKAGLVRHLLRGRAGGEFFKIDADGKGAQKHFPRSEEHTSELQSRENLVCRLLLEKKKFKKKNN